MKSTRLAAMLLASAACAGIGIAKTAPTSAPAGKPTYGTFGFDESGMDKSVAPGDDFFAYANGGWIKRTEIPSDKPSYSMFDVLQDLSTERTQGILQNAGPNTKIGMAYATYLDTKTIDAKGLAPIQPWLNRIKSTDRAGYAALVADASKMAVGGPIGGGVGADDKDPNTYVVSLRQSGLGMPDRDYYLSDKPDFVKIKGAYQAHIARVLTMAGEPNAEARAAALVAYETAIAGVHWTNVQNRDSDATYNKMTVADLVAQDPGFDFAGYLQAAGTPVSTLIVEQPSALKGIAALVGAAPMQVLQDQLIIRSLDGYADVLPSNFDAERFAFFGNTLLGTPEQAVRWKRAVSFTQGALTDEVSKLYIAKYFPPATKAAADTLVRNIISAMNARIDNLTWMKPETKKKAHEKLAAFTPRIGYPSQWHDYGTMQIVAGDAFGNKMRAAQWNRADNVSRLGTPVRRWEWGMTPMTVNAQANPTLVAITFPAAILQAPFFDPNADPAVNYGGIGVVIGHEMSHHFDDQGAKYDVHGALTQWWTDQDITEFKQRSDALVAQYDAYEPLPGMHLKGRLTLGENSADLAGLNASLDAYHKSLGGKPGKTIGGYTPEQRFYLAYAQVWRRKHREGDLRQRLLTDPHSPGPQRVYEVRNLDVWYKAFDVKPGQKLYLAPDQRVRIW